MLKIFTKCLSITCLEESETKLNSRTLFVTVHWMLSRNSFEIKHLLSFLVTSFSKTGRFIVLQSSGLSKFDTTLAFFHFSSLFFVLVYFCQCGSISGHANKRL